VITSGVAGKISIPPTISEISCNRSWRRLATPKLPPPPRIVQKRSGFAFLARLHNLTVSSDHLGSKQVVDRQPVLPRQEADSTSEGDPADPDRAGVSQACDTASLTDGVGVLTRCAPGLNPGGLCVGINVQGAHAGEVNHHPAFAGPVARAVVAAAPDGQLEAALAGARDNASNVICAGDSHDRGGPAVEALEEDLARLVVSRIVGADDFALQLRTEIGNRNILGLWR
jgi:hypothetical protein